MAIDYKQLVFAREYRGYSQSDLAKRIEGLSQSNLSKFEKGLGALSEEIVTQIINYLNFPKEFFSQRIYNTIVSAHYRKKSSITKKLENHIDISLKLIGYIIDEMAADVEWPAMNVRGFNIEDGYTVESAAENTRKVLGVMPDIPIKEICKILEGNGIIIVEYNPTTDFDGVSFYTDGGYPVIVINSSFSNDRKRYTIAHELGHIVLHLTDNIFVSDDRDKELEANNFASEFLMPQKYIKQQLSNLKLGDLGSFKQYWLTSMASIIRRAKDLGCIDYNKYSYFNVEMSRSGYKKKEPINVFIDKPKLFNTGYQILKEHLDLSDDEMAKYIGLPIDIIQKLFNKENSVENKLRIVI